MCQRDKVMANNSTTKESQLSSVTSASDETCQEFYEIVTAFFRGRANYNIKPQHNVKDAFSNLMGGVLNVVSVERGNICCALTVKPPILNAYGGMQGGAVGAVAARVANACARTVIGKDKDLFLGELSISYLSAAPQNSAVVVDGSVVRSGRNLTVVAVNFRVKESGRLAFMTRCHIL